MKLKDLKINPGSRPVIDGKPRTLFIPNDTYDAISYLAYRLRTTKSEFIRCALNYVIEELNNDCETRTH